MFERQNPYFRSAMHHAKQEAECRESAERLARREEEETMRQAGRPDPSDPQASSESRQFECGLSLESILLKIETQDAERHAKMRGKMEPYL